MTLETGKNVQVGNRPKLPASKTATIPSQVPSAATGGGCDPSLSTSRISVTITDRTCVRAEGPPPPSRSGGDARLPGGSPQHPPRFQKALKHKKQSQGSACQLQLQRSSRTQRLASAAAAARAASATSGGAWSLAAASRLRPAAT